MNGSVEVPTIAVLNDLVARCSEINRYATQLTAAEESRVAALAAALVSMRQVLELERVGTMELPVRHARVAHWTLTGTSVIEAETTPIRQLQGLLVLDDHGQVKILSGKTWRGAWQTVSLWRDGVHGLRAAPLMDYLARLVGLANERAPEAARALLERRQAIETTAGLTGSGPRVSTADVRR
ncbi:MAG: hypothetical protein ABR499_05365 [Gemmatimonadaceae bacterium]